MCVPTRAHWHVFSYIYRRRVMNQNVSGKTRYCHKDNTTDQNSPPVVSMKRLFAVSKPYPHTSPGTLSSLHVSWAPKDFYGLPVQCQDVALVSTPVQLEDYVRKVSSGQVPVPRRWEGGRIPPSQPIRLRCVDMKHNSKRYQTVFVWKMGMGRKDWYFWIQKWAFFGPIFRGELLVWGWRNVHESVTKLCCTHWM